ADYMIPLRRAPILIIVAAVLIGVGSNFHTSAQRQKIASLSPEVAEDLAPSEMRTLIEYYIADRGSLQRSFFVNNSPARRERFRKFYSDRSEERRVGKEGRSRRAARELTKAD